MGEPTPALEDRLRQQDAEALAELFTANRERLRCIIRFRMDSRVVGRLDPEDVLQEAYLAATQRLAHFATSGLSPFGWLRIVALQALADIHRQHVGAQRRSVERERPGQIRIGANTSALMASRFLGHLTSPSQAAARAEVFQMLELAIESMDELDREVLALRHFEELGNLEIAEALGIQPKAASIRYVRALRRLRELLARIPGLAGELPDASRSD